jgi:predicted nucleic acid-binding protein
MISYDVNILICGLDRHSVLHKESNKIVWQAETEGCVLSAVLVQEFLVGAYRQGGQKMANRFKDFIAALSNTTIQPVTVGIAQKAAELTQKYPKVRRYDALYIATALLYKADVFYTNDKDLHGEFDGLPVKGLPPTRLRPEVEAELRKISADAKRGVNLSPAFHTVEESIAWLDEEVASESKVSKNSKSGHKGSVDKEGEYC